MMMSLDELDAMKESVKKPEPPSFQYTIKDELEHVNWKLVIAIAFGFLMWYAGTAMLDNFIHTCSKNSPTCEEP